MQLVSQSVFLRILGWALLNSVWQMGLLWFAYAVITSGGKRFSAATRHGIAFSLLSAGCLWFLFTLTNGNTFSVAAFFSSDNNSSFFANSIFIFLNRISDFSLPYLSAGYIVTLFFLFARYCNFYWHCRRLRYTGLYKIKPELRIFANEAAQHLGIKKKVSVWLSSVADSPMTVGFLKSVILIPVATINNLSPQQAEAILLHELAHIKRNDYLKNLLITVMGILFFFNPFTRLLIQNIRKETENSCDDLVMQFRYDPHSYASALLSLEKMRSQHQLAMAAIGRNNHLLLDRVKRITGQQYRFRLNGAKIILLLLFIVLSIFVKQFELKKNTSVAVANRYFVNNPSSEITKIVFHQYPLMLPNDIKIEKQNLVKKNTPQPKDAEYTPDMTDKDVLLASNDEDEDASAKNNMTAVIHAESENQDYTLEAASNAALAQEEIKSLTANNPFVPKSSFTYKATEDTSHPNTYKMDYDAKMAQESMIKAMAALDEIDWEKLKKEISKTNKAVNIEKLQEQLRKSIAQVDWQKINAETPSVITQNDLQKMNRDIKIELQQLQNTQIKNVREAQNFRNRLQNEQIKLERESLQKQQQLLKKLEVLKHKKIVYI